MALCSLWDSLGHYPFTLLLSWGHCLFPRQVVSPYLRAPGPPLDLCFPLWPPLSLNYSVSLCLSAWLLHQHYPLLDPEGVRWLVGESVWLRNNRPPCFYFTSHYTLSCLSVDCSICLPISSASVSPSSVPSQDLVFIIMLGRGPYYHPHFRYNTEAWRVWVTCQRREAGHWRLLPSARSERR